MCDNQNLISKEMDSITYLDIEKLLDYFSKTTYRTPNEDSQAGSILKRCIKLLEIDYTITKICNKGGDLCPHYPSQIPILNNENSCNRKTDRNSDSSRNTERIDLSNIRDHCYRSKLARCRLRFPVPTILYHGKYVCRSSTLSGSSEMYARSGLECWYKKNEQIDPEDQTDASYIPSLLELLNSNFRKNVRDQDLSLLERLNVDTIVDLMVENRKLKYCWYVTSSEKIEREQYSLFNLVSIPYPGCEFFRDFRDNNYTAEGLVFGFNNDECDAPLSMPFSPCLRNLKIDWANYKQWDLVLITHNYIGYILKHLQCSDSGMLIHCISGWDRTPLFISLVRLSLWADGLIHRGLDELQMLYLTIAYDWLLFGHSLPDRLEKGEIIFYFCFYFLKYLKVKSFSIATEKDRHVKRNVETVEELAQLEEDFTGVLLLDEDNLGASNTSVNSIDSNISNRSWCNVSNDDSSPCDNRPSEASISRERRSSSPIMIPTSSGLNPSPSSTSPQVDQSHASWQIVSGTGSLKKSHSDIELSQTPMTTLVGSSQSSDADIPSGDATTAAVFGDYKFAEMDSPSPMKMSADSANPIIDSTVPVTESIGAVADSACPIADSTNSAGPSADEDECQNCEDCLEHQKRREERLENMRRIFYKAYHHTIDIQLGPRPSVAKRLSSFVGNLFSKE